MSDDNRPEAAAFGTYAPRPIVARLIAATRRMPDSWPGKRAAFLLRGLAIRLLNGAAVDAETLGARMRLHPYNNVCEKRVLFTPQFFDREEREILRSRIGEGFCFIDIGANVGAYALFVAALAGPRARILAVEPQPAIFERLVANMRLNPFGTIKALDCAVADKAGPITLFIDARNSGESSVRVVGPGVGSSIRVPAVTLLDLIQEEGFARVDAVKLDVEGAEDLILQPFLASAPPHLLPKLLILENGRDRWQTDLMGALTRGGYRKIARTRLNFVLERD